MAAKKTTDKATEKTPVSDKKAAVESVIARIEKECGKGSIMRLGEDPSMNVSAVSTGSLSLDFALGVGGIPRGRASSNDGDHESLRNALAVFLQSFGNV